MSTKKRTASATAEPIRTIAVPDGEAEVMEGAAQEAAPESVVYLGPHIGKFINHGTVYAGGVLPDYLRAKIAEIPAISGLIVPVSRYSEVAKLITLPEGRYRALYDLIASTAN